MNIESESPLFKNVAKILQTCYFGYFENVSPPQPKTINKLDNFTVGPKEGTEPTLFWALMYFTKGLPD